MKKEKFRFCAVWISIICVIFYSLEIFVPNFFENFALSSSEIILKPWTLLTYVFLHENPKHLFFNLFALVLFGSILEKIIGYRNFLVVFFISGIVAGLGGLKFYSSMIGASGAVFGILGILGVLRPRMVVWIWGVPMYMMFAIIFWIALNFVGIMNPDKVAYISHLFGLFFGIAVGLKLKKKYGIKRRKRRKEKELISEEEFERWEDKYMRHKA